jgi:hypothetical protein
MFGPPFTPYPLSQWHLQSNEILLNLSMKCTKFESNYSSCTSRSSENICRRSGGAHEKERQDETQFTTKIGGKTCLGPSYFVL